MNTFDLFATKRRVIGDEFAIIFVPIGNYTATSAEEALAIARNLGHTQAVVAPSPSPAQRAQPKELQ